MYRILIADDEGIVRDSLKFIIERDFGSDCEVFSAKSGRQAIELFEAERPDIGLLDIQMPGINGLGALAEMKKQNPKFKALILTAYDNFEYAAEAIKLGAADYLMKPMDRKKVGEALKKLMYELDGERAKRQQDLKIQERMETVIPIIENGFVMSLITRDEYCYAGNKYRSLLNVEENYGYVLALEWGEGFDKDGPGNPIGASVRARKFIPKMNGQIRSCFKVFLSDAMGNKIICVAPTEREALSYKERLRRIEKVRAMTTSLREITGIDFKAGIGSVRTWEEMYNSYHEALNALRHGVRKVTHIDDLAAWNTGDRQQAEARKNILNALRRGSEIEIRREAEWMISYLLQPEAYRTMPVSVADTCMDETDGAAESRIEHARIVILEILMAARQLASEQGYLPLGDAEIAVVKAADAKELQTAFLDAMLQYGRRVFLAGQRTDTVAGRAKEYMRKNFQRDLSLESVATELNISPYYFSKLFKEGTGENFSDFLTDLRIGRAKTLLYENPERNIKEICIEAGYTNPNYFSRIFKKYTGMTPTEMRDRLREGK